MLILKIIKLSGLLALKAFKADNNEIAGGSISKANKTFKNLSKLQKLNYFSKLFKFGQCYSNFDKIAKPLTLRLKNLIK